MNCVSLPRALVWFCVNLAQARVISEKGASAEEMPPGDPAVGRTQFSVSGAIPELVVLGSIRKQTNTEG